MMSRAMSDLTAMYVLFIMLGLFISTSTNIVLSYKEYKLKKRREKELAAKLEHMHREEDDDVNGV